MGKVFRLSMPWGTKDYRVDAVNRFGNVTSASYRVTDEELKSDVGEWDECRNVNVLLRLTKELRA